MVANRTEKRLTTSEHLVFRFLNVMGRIQLRSFVEGCSIAVRREISICW